MSKELYQYERLNFAIKYIIQICLHSRYIFFTSQYCYTILTYCFRSDNRFHIILFGKDSSMENKRHFSTCNHVAGAFLYNASTQTLMIVFNKYSGIK